MIHRSVLWIAILTLILTVGTRHIWWNFVASSEERIERAKADWRAGRFRLPAGDDVEFIPLPDEPLGTPPPAEPMS